MDFTLDANDAQPELTFHLFDLDGIHSAQHDIMVRHLHTVRAGQVDTVKAQLFFNEAKDDRAYETLAEAVLEALANNGLEGFYTAHRDWDKTASVVVCVPEVLVLALSNGRFSGARGVMFLSEWRSEDEVLPSLDLVVETLRQHGCEVGRNREREDKVEVNFAVPSKAGVSIYDKEFTKLPFEAVQANYQPEVVQEFPKLVERIREAHNGLFILHGPPGTGKSYLIRALLSELKEARQGVVCTPPQPFLADFGMLTEATMSADKPSVTILEDVGEMLLEDNVTAHVNETSNLLNLADGLLSLLSNTVLVLTFNTDVGRLNPALLRPGRCLGQLTVGSLPRRQAEELTGLGLTEREYTLAEVYEMLNTGQEPAAKPTERRSAFRV